MVSTYKFQLEKYKGQRTRHTCPGCDKAKQFTRYINTETNQYLAEHVGKCNRESKCGYHYTPSQFFRDNPEAGNQQGEDWKASEVYKTVYQPPKEELVQYLPRGILNKTLTGYQANNFVRFLTSLFGEEKALSLALKYKLGTSNKFQNDGGKAVIFWQIDKTGNIHQAKVMAYNPRTGKRLKGEGKHYVSFMGKAILKNREANLQQCLFGEHLLKENTGLTVAMVESEKTAVLMSGFLPDVIWLATGGKNGARWTDKSVYKALAGRTVVIYPDLGAFDEWKEKAKILGTVCSYQVSELLEQKAQGNDLNEGYDIADYFIKPKEEPIQAQEPEPEASPHADGLPQGWKYEVFPNGHKVLIDNDGLPATWNLCPKNEMEKEAIEQEEKRTGIQANPVVGHLIERFGMEIESIEHWEPEEETEPIIKTNKRTPKANLPIKKEDADFFDNQQFDKPTIQRMIRVQRKAIERTKLGRRNEEELILQKLEECIPIVKAE